MGLYEVFFGSAQSQYAAYAILAAIFTICMTILFSGTDMTIGSRLLMILFVILTLIPSIFLILFEITCMVSGGTKDKNWWCWLYAWIIAVFIIIYCIFVVIISLSSLFTYNTAMEKLTISENNNIMSPDSSNQYARDMLLTNTPEQKEQFYIEHFYNAMGMPPKKNRELEGFTGTTTEDNQEQVSNSSVQLSENYENSSNVTTTSTGSTGSSGSSRSTGSSGSTGSTGSTGSSGRSELKPTTSSSDLKKKKVEETFEDEKGVNDKEIDEEDDYEAFSNFNYARY